VSGKPLKSHMQRVSSLVAIYLVADFKINRSFVEKHCRVKL